MAEKGIAQAGPYSAKIWGLLKRIFTTLAVGTLVILIATALAVGIKVGVADKSRKSR